MKLIVLIKQVPETSNVKMDETTGTIIREGLESIINPLDLYAIETGIQLKEQHGGMLTVMTMGPPASKEALKEALAMGCDHAIQICHKCFSGADTWATSHVLAEAIKRRIGQFDLILCGERATDGETGQVGPGVASFLDLPLVTYVNKIYDITEGNGFRVHRLVEGGYEVLSLPFPALLTVVKEICTPRLANLRGYMRAQNIAIPVVGPDDIQVKDDWIGLHGSPTRVVKIFRPRVSRQGERYQIKKDTDIELVVEKLIQFFKKKQLL